MVSAACTLNVIHREPMWLNVLGAFQLPTHAGPILRELPEPSASEQPSVSFEFPRLCFVVGISWERWICRTRDIARGQRAAHLDGMTACIWPCSCKSAGKYT